MIFFPWLWALKKSLMFGLLNFIRVCYNRQGLTNPQF